MYFICSYLTCFFVHCLVCAGAEIIWHFVLLPCVPALSVLFCGTLLLLQLWLLDVSIVSEANFLPSCQPLVILKVILSMFSSLMSGIPSSARLSTFSTFVFVSNLYCTHAKLFNIQLTVHFYMTELFLVLCNSAKTDYGNRILNTVNSIKIPLLLVST